MSDYFDEMQVHLFQQLKIGVDIEFFINCYALTEYEEFIDI